MGSIVAIADIGTNLCTFLVAEVKETNDFDILLKKTDVLLLGQGTTFQKGELSENAFERLQQAFLNFECEPYVLAHKIALGTSAIRNLNASNQLKVESFLAAKGWQLKVITGAYEAELIFDGLLLSNLFASPKPTLAIDIGGGSVEFMLGCNNTLIWKKSIEIGMQRMQQMIPINDTINEKIIINIINVFNKHLNEVFKTLKKHLPEVMVGAAGVFETLNWQTMDKALQDVSKIDISLFKSHLNAILKSNKATRLQLKGMPSYRVNMYIHAMLLINLIVENLNITSIYATSFNLKEGALKQYFTAKS